MCVKTGANRASAENKPAAAGVSREVTEKPSQNAEQARFIQNETITYHPGCRR